MGTAAEIIVNTRQMTLADIPAVYEIEKISFAEAWQVEHFQEYLQRENTAGVVAEIENKIAAYVTLAFFDEVAGISKFAIAPEFRRRTLGKSFLEFTLNLIRKRGGGTGALVRQYKKCSGYSLVRKLRLQSYRAN